MQDRDRRRAAIRELLLEAPVRNQEELLEKLERRGLGASQPVLSRDLRALNVAKRGGYYQIVEEERVTPLEELKSLLRTVEPVSRFYSSVASPAPPARSRARSIPKNSTASSARSPATTPCSSRSKSHAAALRVRRRVQELL
jgi:hypothetical protein